MISKQCGEVPMNEAEVAVCAATASVLGKDGGLLGSLARSWRLKVHLKELKNRINGEIPGETGLS